MVGLLAARTTPDDIDADFTERLQAFVGRDEGSTTETVVDPFVVTRLVESLGDRNPVYSFADTDGLTADPA
ncbi:hypothetical protein P3H15_55070 [Rhodococcus sp. T2V]|uniref:hypothetical protein n=1 Tax=Rhodococcus sp. T2V TaxID=3034164 RepID=UPI0023E31762|nr:hypothetical protein [Rhodococcus sp. T2V]MDF3313953.1 hypothetical protein [Rhodococcus sp. T2V]